MKPRKKPLIDAPNIIMGISCSKKDLNQTNVKIIERAKAKAMALKALKKEK